MKPLFAIALLLASCTSMPSHDDTPAAQTHARYLALGDSYTIGESVPSAENFPHQLASALGLGEPQIIAKTGWTTDELNAAIDAANPQGPYDLVTLLIGVNNQYRGRDAEQYRGEFTALLRRAIGFAGGDASNVVVVSIPDWGVTPFAEGRDRAKIASEIDRYNAINREEAMRAGDGVGAERMLVALGRCGYADKVKSQLLEIYETFGWGHHRAVVSETW